MRNQTLQKQILHTLGPIVFSIVLCEIVLRLIAWAYPPVRPILTPNYERKIPTFFEDSILGTRPNPDFPGHDPRGFRNDTALEKADIVTIGDSHVYGANVEPHEAWPTLLSEITRKNVYNMSFPGYGPVQYHALLDDALKLNPEVVIVGIYFGNDIFNAFNMAYKNTNFRALRQANAEEERALFAIEEDAALVQQVERQKKHHAKLSKKALKKRRADSSELVRSLRRFLYSNSKLYLLGKAIKNKFIHQEPHDPKGEVKWKQALKTTANLSPWFDFYENENVWATFRSPYRHIALNREDIRIQEGLKITLHIIKQMQTRAESAGARLIVAFLPTKEIVFSSSVQADQYPVSKSYRALIEDEILTRNEIKRFLRENNIQLSDPLPLLQEVVSSGQSPYFSILDDHPNKLGHQTIADSIYESLTQKSIPSKKIPSKAKAPVTQEEKKQNKAVPLKVLTLVGGFLVGLTLLTTKKRSVRRPNYLLVIFLTYVGFQCIFMLEFFPLTAFQMFSFPEPHKAHYLKMEVYLEDGTEVALEPHEVLPMLADGRAKEYVRDSFTDPRIADSFATTYSKAYDKKFRKPGAPGVKEVHYEDWLWDFQKYPNDPARGKMMRGIIGKPQKENNV